MCFDIDVSLINLRILIPDLSAQYTTLTHIKHRYEDCIKRDPTNAPFRNNLAAAYLKMGLFNDAKREVEKSLEIDPKYVISFIKRYKGLYPYANELICMLCVSLGSARLAPLYNCINYMHNTHKPSY